MNISFFIILTFKNPKPAITLTIAGFLGDPEGIAPITFYILISEFVFETQIYL